MTLTADDAFDPATPRPWRRFFAKAVDFSIYSIMILVTVFVLAIAAAFAGVEFGYEYPHWVEHVVLTPIAIVLCCLIDALFLGLVGTTPGRALFRIHVAPNGPGELTPGVAMRRNVRLAALGLGLGLPIVALVMQIVSYRALVDNGITPWDRRENLVVTYGETSEARLAGQIAAVLLAFAFNIALNLA